MIIALPKSSQSPDLNLIETPKITMMARRPETNHQNTSENMPVIIKVV